MDTQDSVANSNSDIMMYLLRYKFLAIINSAFCYNGPVMLRYCLGGSLVKETSKKVSGLNLFECHLMSVRVLAGLLTN